MIRIAAAQAYVVPPNKIFVVTGTTSRLDAASPPQGGSTVVRFDGTVVLTTGQSAFYKPNGWAHSGFIRAVPPGLTAHAGVTVTCEEPAGGSLTSAVIGYLADD